ncbi:protein Daple isoform X2 [Aphidius gifuensis]|uniref:protein Daple isoform X2 n=1 Tax=Aphidius gifuensis TaxID=684658 RepID=UPI001CDCD750|nr:protein Daple isoform X2 [Aphidius gifuensis]
MGTPDIDNFLAGRLVEWFDNCLEDDHRLASYDELVDGTLIHNVFLQMNIEPIHDGIIPSCGNPIIRMKNLEMIVGNIKQFYEEELGHILMKVPDITNLGKDPENNIQEMELLLILLLGCAVQCPRKETFMEKITNLYEDKSSQHIMVDYIKQVTLSPGIVLTQEMMENCGIPSDVFKDIKKLNNERNIYKDKCRIIGIDELSLIQNNNLSSYCDKNSSIRNKTTKSEYEENHHNAVTLADVRSQLRKKKQECDEYKESLNECQLEIEITKETMNKLKQENQELMHEARIAKSYRDELDVVMEKAERADKLELEVSRYREKCSELQFCRTTITQLKEEKQTLEETCDMLEEQLNSSRCRSDKVLELEAQLIKYKQMLNDMVLERASDKEKYHELIEENTQLRQFKKAADDEAENIESISETDEPINCDNRLSEQLTNNAQTRALKLQVENGKLLAMIDKLKENKFYESSNKLLELEKDKKKMSLKIESLNDNNDRLIQQNSDLELICQKALDENKKLQNTLKNQRTSFEKQQQDYQSQQLKIAEFEKNYDIAIKEKQRVQSLFDSVCKRADELERSLELSNQRIDELKIVEDKLKKTDSKISEMVSKIVILEKDKESLTREIHKCRELIEEKDVALDKATNSIELLEKKLSDLDREIDNSASQIIRLQEIEKTSKELDSQAAIDKETMKTLQSNLIAEKLNTQQLQTCLEKLGLSVDSLLNLNVDNIVDTLIKLPEVSRHIENSKINHITPTTNTDNDEDTPVNKNLREKIELMKKEIDNIQLKLSTSQTTADNLLEEQAKLQVSITTLQSKNTSLNAQHTALQLANSQLVAEKEELLKDRDVQQRTHQQLLHDQVTLQKLHEQLNNEYENLLQERETLKINLRDAKNIARTLRENLDALESKNKQLLSEQEIAASNVKSLNNLRGEHSKLKDDFRNLYTATEKLKLEYRSLQDDYRKNKIETNRLSLKQTELQGEVSTKEERCANLELQINKLNQRCEMLMQMTSGLDNNRRSLMDHVSVLLNQYHDLLTHSMEDKEHYHMEEKLYRDQVNNLSRQKEKLEEKIMEYYRNKQSCSTKKKRFGANLVKQVKKVSDILKNRQSWADDSKQSDGKSESGGNDSDVSVDDHRAAADSTELDNDSFSLGTPGTRRTVYYTDDSPSSATSLPVINQPVQRNKHKPVHF